MTDIDFLLEEWICTSPILFGLIYLKVYCIMSVACLSTL